MKREFSLEWMMQDNSVITMTAEQVVGMSTVLAQYNEGLHRTAQELRKQIEAAKTKEELELIQWVD